MLSPLQFFSGTSRVWQHYKGNLYLVLYITSLLTEHVLTEGQRLALWVDYDEKTIGDSEFRSRVLCAPFREYEAHDYKGVMHLGEADYTGESRVVKTTEPLVVYVGLYNNPKGNRLCTRPVVEWGELVEIPGKLAAEGRPRHEDVPAHTRPRYVRVSAS